MPACPESTWPEPDTPLGHGHALFDTAIGTCGIAWGPGGIVAVQLPEVDARATRERMLRSPGLLQCTESAEPPAAVRSAIAGIQALLSGQPRDLREVPLDMTGISPFHQQVYAIARAIPPGSTRT